VLVVEVAVLLLLVISMLGRVPGITASASVLYQQRQIQQQPPPQQQQQQCQGLGQCRVLVLVA
jgi:hypothetical protein